MSSVSIQGNASGTGIFTIASPNSNTNRTLTLPEATTTVVGTDATQTLTNKTIQGGAITSGTAVASTSGTSIDFTSIPSWVKRITVIFNGVSTNGTSVLQVRLGTSSGITTTGYVTMGVQFSTTAQAGATATSGFTFGSDTEASDTQYGQLIIATSGSNNWVATGSIYGGSTVPRLRLTTGGIALGGTLDRVRITTVNGTDTFDAGSVNILYEG